MTRFRSRRLQPVQAVARRREQGAARALTESQGRQAAARRQLEELECFRREYAHRFQQAGRVGLGGKALQEYQQFLAQLDQAIAAQRARLAAGEAELGTCRETWRGLRARARALDRVVERLQAGERRRRERREQAASDERAQHTGRWDTGSFE